MIGNFGIIDILLLVVLWFITSMIANLIWTRFVVLRYVGRAVMAWIDGIDKDPEAKEVLSKLFLMMFDWVGSARIKTGQKIKVTNEDGEEKEVEEILAPVDLLAKVISSYFFNKYRASMGPVKTQIAKVLREEAASLGGDGLVSPAALMALSKGKLGPVLGELALNYLPKKKLNTTGENIETVGDGRY